MTQLPVGGGGHTVSHLVETLRYKTKCRSSITDGVTEIFIDIILPAAVGQWDRLNI